MSTDDTNDKCIEVTSVSANGAADPSLALVWFVQIGWNLWGGRFI